MAGRATIKDVAQKAGYSITTVSLVLNNKKNNIPLKTRQKVLKAAKELNYTPNHMAVSMITKRSNALGLITPDISNMFFAAMTKSVESTASAAGYAMILGNTGNDAQREYDTLQMFLNRYVDGIIFFVSAIDQDGLQSKAFALAKEMNTPLLIIDRPNMRTDFPSIMLNHVNGGYLATKHLIELGHKNIACLTGLQNVSACIALLEGYKKALDEAGIVYNENLVFESNFHPGKEDQALDQFSKQNATAIFCFNDLMATALYRTIRSRGLSIPDDYSIIGYDDMPFADLIEPSMTTVRQRVNEIGICATNLLIDLIENKPIEKTSYMFEPELIIRKSTKAL